MRFIILLLTGFFVIFFTTSSFGIDKKILDSAGVHELKQIAPDFSLYSLNGEKVSLKDYRGKVVILHFWATWCDPCKEEMPTIEKMHREFKNSDLVILTVSIDKRGIDTVRSYVKEFTFPVLVSLNGKLNDAYLTWGIPVSYIVDRNGRLIGRTIGPRNWNSDDMKNLIKEILRD